MLQPRRQWFGQGRRFFPIFRDDNVVVGSSTDRLTNELDGSKIVDIENGIRDSDFTRESGAKCEEVG